MRGKFSIGVDPGGTNLRAAAVDSPGKLLYILAGQTARMEGREPILDEMTEAENPLGERCGVNELSGIGIAVPGFILLKEGVIRNSNNLAAIEDFPIRDEMSRRLGTPVILENDANAAALGEKWIGAGRGVDDLVLVVNAWHRLTPGTGGGVPGGWDLFAPAMSEETRRRSFTFRTTETRIERAVPGNQAGLFGAACLPWARGHSSC